MYWDLTYRPQFWGPCLSCGYCPCCGRSRHSYPSYPWTTATGTTAAVDPAKMQEWRRKLTEMTRGGDGKSMCGVNP